jgi:hypothetical protein
LWFVNTSMKSAPQYSKLLPGQTPAQFAPQLYRDPSAYSGIGLPGRDSALNRPGVTAEQAMAGGRMYAGNPDTVYKQIMDFYDKVGGFGHLIMVGKTGFITHTEAVKEHHAFFKGGPPSSARDQAGARRVSERGASQVGRSLPRREDHHHASERLRQKSFAIATNPLECSPADLELRDGGVGVVGVPGAAVSLAKLAQAARPGWISTKWSSDA